MIKVDNKITLSQDRQWIQLNNKGIYNILVEEDSIMLIKYNLNPLIHVAFGRYIETPTSYMDDRVICMDKKDFQGSKILNKLEKIIEVFSKIFIKISNPRKMDCISEDFVINGTSSKYLKEVIHEWTMEEKIIRNIFIDLTNYPQLFL